MVKLSVVLATRNEEKNIGRCLESVKNIADEIIIVDEYSVDKTREIAEKYGAKVYLEPHHEIFHITKERALEKAAGDWILQLDADEVITPELAKEIVGVVNGETPLMVAEGLLRGGELRKKELFLRHQKLIEERDGRIGKSTGEIVAFFIPRLNIFLGKPLRFGGVYPDGVIRLVKKGKARFPQKSVHEQIEIDGKVSWLFNPLKHYDSPTLARYLARMNRYTDLKVREFASDKIGKNPWNFLKFSILLPAYYFLLLFVRHKGFLDGVQGFLWAFFSAMHFPIAYFKYISLASNRE